MALRIRAGMKVGRRTTVEGMVAWAALVLAVLAQAGGALAQSTPASAPLPADPWPRQVALGGTTVLVYQPQVDSWTGNRLTFRAAVAVRPAGKSQTFGVIWA